MIQRLVGTLGWLLAAWVLSSILLLRNAAAMCGAPGLMEQAREGSWSNVNPHTQSLRRMEIRFVCKDVTSGPDDEAWAGFTVQPFGVCSSGECDWGWSRTESLPGELWHAAYKDSDATRYLFVRMSPYGARQLQVYIWTDFSNEGRQDYGSWDWLERAAPTQRGKPGVPSGQTAEHENSLERNTDLDAHAPAQVPPLVLAAMSRQVASGPAAAAASFPEDPAPPPRVCTRDCRCKDPQYLRVHNDSSVNFDSVKVDGLEFGPLRAQAVSEYQQVKTGSCIYSQGEGYVRTKQGRMGLPPFNPRGETPLVGEYYARHLMNADVKSRSIASRIVPDVPPPGRFEGGQAEHQMDDLARWASLCRDSGTTRGAGRIRVVIQATGSVVSVTHLNQDFVGTPVGNCITQVFRQVRVPPFSGSTQTLTGSFLIPP